jgi:hypothetical protein
MPPSLLTLTEIAAGQTDKGALGYTTFYERHFKHLRRKRFDLLEVGTHEGGGLRMWVDWAPCARIVGVDIAPVQTVNTDRISTVVGDIDAYQPDRTFDIVIDDGSHRPDDITRTFDRLWPHVKPGGLYAIEDLEVHAPQYRGSREVTNWLAGILRGVCHGDGRNVFASHGEPRLDVPSETGVFAVYAYPRLVILEKEP